MNTARKLFYYNGGFLRQKRVRRILSMAGYELTLGLPDRGDMVACLLYTSDAADE